MNNDQMAPIITWAACFWFLMNLKFLIRNKITRGVSGSPNKKTRRDLYSWWWG